MAKSLKQQIKESEARTRRLKNKLPLSLGKSIMNNHKITITNAHGKPVMYKSTAKDTKGQTLKRTRTIDSLNEFNDHFKVVPATESGLHTVYLIKLGFDVMKMHGATNDGDFIRVDRELKHDHDDDSADNKDNQNSSDSSQDSPEDMK